MRGRLIFWLAAISILAIAGLFYVSSTYYRNAELQHARSRVTLYHSTLVGALERFQHLPFVLANDPFVISAATGIDRAGLNVRLAEFASRANLEAIYLMDLSGLTVAASNHDAAITFVGQNYGFRPYFNDALAGRRGEFFGVGATTSRPGYFIAEVVRNSSGEPSGVIALKLSLSELQSAWAKGGETVFVSNADGVVILSSQQNWLYRTLAPISQQRLQEIGAGQQFRNKRLAPLDWQSSQDSRVALDGHHYLHATSTLPRLNWTLHFLADEERVRERTWSTVIVAAIILSLLLALAIFLRSERIRAALEASWADRRQLRAANTRLEQEIDERRIAEARLEKAQSELARASNLAALGQLSASVTHELGQPISAMRNYLAAAELEDMNSDRSDTMVRLRAIVGRMEHITKQLRFFAKPSERLMEPVDLRDVLEGARELVLHDLKDNGVELITEVPDSRVIVRGNRLRLEQVLVNLIRNSVAAMEESTLRQLTIRIHHSSPNAILVVEDTGHGLGDRSMERLQEPFHTTRASGRGMGLGLAISAAIVKEHNGRIFAKNRDLAGAVFTIEFPLDSAGDAA